MRTRTVPLLLVVDDDAAVAGMLASELTEAGYEVLRARDGREGLESFERWHPDLVLTDAASGWRDLRFSSSAA